MHLFILIALVLFACVVSTSNQPKGLFEHFVLVVTTNGKFFRKEVSSSHFYPFLFSSTFKSFEGKSFFLVYEELPSYFRRASLCYKNNTNYRVQSIH